MSIILLTILLTLLGAGLVVYLIWLGVVSWKGLKLAKQNKTGIDDIITTYHHGVDEIYQNISKGKDDLYKRINDNTNELWNKVEKLESSLDSRLDKLNNKFKNCDCDCNCNCKKK